MLLRARYAMCEMSRARLKRRFVPSGGRGDAAHVHLFCFIGSHKMTLLLVLQPGGQDGSAEMLTLMNKLSCLIVRPYL